MSFTSDKPRLAIFGEFSSGKSTLINTLAGRQLMPTRTIATHTPPVWLSHGTDPWCVVGLDGSQRTIGRRELDRVPVAGTAFIRIFDEAPILAECDIVDTPGNADPNISAETWQRMVAHVDLAIWCTSATNAWRQSELAAWREMPDELRARSLLVMTRADKIETQRDREKILARVQRDAGRHFRAIHMVSAIDPLTLAGLAVDLVNLCREVSGLPPVAGPDEAMQGVAVPVPMDLGDEPAPAPVAAAPVSRPAAPAQPARVVPRRVTSRARREEEAERLRAQVSQGAWAKIVERTGKFHGIGEDPEFLRFLDGLEGAEPAPRRTAGGPR